jgi:putative transposase
MPRGPRQAPGGLLYHVLNRAVARLPLFQMDGDYQAFEKVMAQALAKHPTRLLSYCLMPNHWHLVIWPREDGELTAFTRWLTHTHTMRWHTHYHTAGSGHLYQGRFKSFPIQVDEHFLTVVRYVERNALRANLVARAQAWRWSSLFRRLHPQTLPALALSPWPVPCPADVLRWIQAPLTEAEMAALRRAVHRGSPYGSETWQKATARKLGLNSTLRPRGRPRKEPAD